MKKIFVATGFVAALAITSLSVFAQSESRDELLKEIATTRTELKKLETDFLAPAEEDRGAYAEFLAQPDTGLIRLLPREVYDKMLAVRGGGAYYSFFKLTHEFGNGTDIGLEQGSFRAGFGGANYGMLVNLGDVPLEQVNSETPGVKFLSVYTAVTEVPHARIEQQRFMVGTTIDGIPFKGSQKAEVNITYVLRSIDYSRSDVLVAFRVIRKDPDGSLIILWKLLKSYPVTSLARQN